jgi:hypothetical protein
MPEMFDVVSLYINSSKTINCDTITTDYRRISDTWIKTDWAACDNDEFCGRFSCRGLPRLLSAGEIAGIVIGTVAGIVLVIGAWFWYRKGKSKEKEPAQKPSELVAYIGDASGAAEAGKPVPNTNTSRASEETIVVVATRPQ